MTSSKEEKSAPYPSIAIAWMVVAILFTVTLFSQLDRQLPALLVKPIKAEFSINDTAFSLLQGYAFAFVYAIMGLPFGKLVDQTHRRNLIIAGVVVWSAMTIFAGFAGTYAQLFLARMGVGVGEAILAPAAYSIIADYVPSQRRGRAMAVYYLSLAVGQGASLLLAGLILREVPVSGATLPAVGHLEPWRISFLLAGLPGIPLVLLLLLVREPVRRDQGDKRDKDSGGLREIIGYVRQNFKALLPIFICPSTLAIAGYSALNWAPAFYERRFGLGAAEIGVMLGGIVTASGVVGTLSSGFISDAMAARGLAAARLRVMVIACLVVLPTSFLWTVVPSEVLSIGLFALMLSAMVFGLSSVAVMVQEIVPNRMRGQIIAAYLLIATLSGIAVAPTVVALLTDLLFRDERAIGWALMMVGGPVSIVGLVAALRGRRPYSALQIALVNAAH